MKGLVLLATVSWVGLWFTPNQLGARYFHRGEFREAAQAFNDPLWKGSAWYRDGEFEKAAQAFAQVNTAEGLYNQGNAWCMRGKYETAVSCYNRALALRPDWREAIENRDLATARAKMVEQKGGDMGDQKLGADKIVFDKNNKEGGQDTEVEERGALSDQQIQALWLRRVQTRPSDFLKAKFSYQHAVSAEASK